MFRKRPIRLLASQTRLVVVSELVLLVTFATSGCQAAKEPPPPAKDPVVEVSVPVSKEVTDYEDFTGMTQAFNFVEVRARVTGFLQKLHFKDGGMVKKDDLLFEIDPIIFAATSRQTEASLRLAQAHLKTMVRNLDRAEDLRQRKANSVEEYDKAVGDRDEAVASVAVAQANRDLAKINLDYTKVTAPIGGRLSRRLVDVGNIVTADMTALTTIVDLGKVYVYFDINERSFLRIRELIKAGKVARSQDKRTVVKVGLANDKGYTLKATVDFEENRVDAGTGTYRVRAVIDNADGFLSPGLFARVRLPIGLPYTPVLVSEQALVSDQGQKYVYVVSAKSEVEYRRVKTGGLHEGLRVIMEGVSKSDKVVVRGMQRIRPGVKVQTQLVTMPVPKTKDAVAPAKKPAADKKPR